MEYINQLINELMAWLHDISNDQVATFWLLLTAFGCGLLSKFLEQIGKKNKFEQMEARFKTILDAVAELRRIIEEPEKKQDQSNDDEYEDSEPEDMGSFHSDIKNVRWDGRNKTLRFEILGDGNYWYEAEAKYNDRNQLMWLRTEGEDDIRHRALYYSKNWKLLQEHFHIA